MKKVVIAAGNRIPFCRAGTNYIQATNQEMMTAAVTGLVNKLNLKGKTLGDVAVGGVMNHSADWNMAREVVLGSGLSAETPAFGVQRACGTSLETVILIANKISLGQIDSGIAGGFDSMSTLPVSFSKNFSQMMMALSRAKTMGEKISTIASLRPKDLKPRLPVVVEARTGLSMGQHCELMAKEWNLNQREQDELALQSHQNALNAWKNGFYDSLVTPYLDATKDNNPRESTIEKMSKLKPVFRKDGTLTAANSSALTDGASCVFLCSEEYAKENNLPIQAYFTDSQVSAVDFVNKEGLLMAPAYAVAKMITRNKISLQDFDYYEIHEAFAAQVLCTLKAWDDDDFCKKKLGLSQKLGKIDRSRLNVAGGSVSLGHPFGATGARVVATLAKLLETKGSGRGLISVCTGGGMGVTAILEKN